MKDYLRRIEDALLVPHQWVYDEISYRIETTNRQMWMYAQVGGLALVGLAESMAGKSPVSLIIIPVAIGAYFLLKGVRTSKPFSKESAANTLRDRDEFIIRLALWSLLVLFFMGFDQILDGVTMTDVIYFIGKWFNGPASILFYLCFEDIDGEKRKARDERRMWSNDLVPSQAQF